MKKGDKMLSKINQLLYHCYKDSIIDIFSNIEFQLFIISTKTLIPYEKKIGCMFDVNRYKNELDLLYYYKNGSDTLLENYFINKKPSTIEDELLEYRILPIIIANSEFTLLIQEVLKMIIFYSYNKDNILNGIILSSIVYEYINKDDLNLDEIKEKTKERLIEFSLKDFFEHNYAKKINKNYMISFEKQRISLLLNDNYYNLDMLMKYKSFQYIFNEKEDLQNVNLVNKENLHILNNFAQYVFKLRKGIVDPEKLHILNIDEDKNLSFKEYFKNSSFVHPLIGKCMVIKRNKKEIILKNKIGLLKVRI